MDRLKTVRVWGYVRVTLIVNGESGEYDGEPTLAALIEARGADPQRVATLLNDTIVKKEARATASLHEGDRVEILAFAGGG